MLVNEPFDDKGWVFETVGWLPPRHRETLSANERE
jgi:hypothetical protein